MQLENVQYMGNISKEIRDASNIDLNNQMNVASEHINFYLIYARPAQEQQQDALDQRKYRAESM